MSLTLPAIRKAGAVERVGIRVWGKAGLGAANQPQPVPQAGAEAGPEGQAPAPPVHREGTA